MPVIKTKCPICHKQVELKEEVDLGVELLQVYTCGHAFGKDAAHILESHDFKSLDGKNEAYDYQKDGVKFIESTNYNCLLADGMGVGKTMQAALAIKNNPKLFKVLIVVQSSIVYQWAKAWEHWVDDSDLACFPILGTKGMIPSCFNVYIISRDTLGRKDFYKKILKLGIKTVIIDEVQAFKASNSNRSEALVNFVKEGNIEHKIMLSGTPIMNKASEYFTALNLLSPIHFPNRTRFCREWLVPNEKGIYTRLNPYRIDRFHELTSKWILRREKEDVLKDLPSFRRTTQWIYIDDPDVKESYNRELSLFDNFMNSASRINAIEILGWLAKFRRIVGNAKIPMTQSYISQFLEQNETEKLYVGIHHETVRETLYEELKLAGFNPLQLSGKDSAADKFNLVRQFHSPDHRIMIANILAGGTGLDGIQECCNNAMVMERQWNSAIEEQFEARVHRNGQLKPVTCDYMNAYGTIDQFLDEKVEEKRQILGETLINGWNLEGDIEGLRSISEKVIANRL